MPLLTHFSVRMRSSGSAFLITKPKRSMCPPKSIVRSGESDGGAVPGSQFWMVPIPCGSNGRNDVSALSIQTPSPSEDSENVRPGYSVVMR